MPENPYPYMDPSMNQGGYGYNQADPYAQQPWGAQDPYGTPQMQQGYPGMPQDGYVDSYMNPENMLSAQDIYANQAQSAGMPPQQGYGYGDPYMDQSMPGSYMDPIAGDPYMDQSYGAQMQYDAYGNPIAVDSYGAPNSYGQQFGQDPYSQFPTNQVLDQQAADAYLYGAAQTGAPAQTNMGSMGQAGSPGASGNINSAAGMAAVAGIAGAASMAGTQGVPGAQNAQTQGAQNMPGAQQAGPGQTPQQGAQQSQSTQQAQQTPQNQANQASQSAQSGQQTQNAQSGQTPNIPIDKKSAKQAKRAQKAAAKSQAKQDRSASGAHAQNAKSQTQISASIGKPIDPSKATPGKATLALVLGILSIIFALLPPIGLALAIVARKFAKTYLENGGRKGSAEAGKIFGLIGIIFSIAMFALIIWFIGFAMGYLDVYPGYINPIAFFNNSPIGQIWKIPTA